MPARPTSPSTCCATPLRAWPEPFEDEYFDFWQRYLAGAQQPRPRDDPLRRRSR